MRTRMQKFIITLSLALIIAGGIVASTGAVAFASTSTAKATQKTLVHMIAVPSSCSAYAVPGGPYAVVVVNRQNPSTVVYLEALRAGYNLVYYLWVSFNGVHGNPIQEGSRAQFTFVGDIYLMGYVGNTPAASICSDWVVVGYQRMY